MNKLDDSNTLHVPILADVSPEIEAMNALAFVRDVYLRLCTVEEFNRAFVWFIDSTEAAIADKEQALHPTSSGDATAARNRATTDPGGMECERCGSIFIGAPNHSLCGICNSTSSGAASNG